MEIVFRYVVLGMLLFFLMHWVDRHYQTQQYKILNTPVYTCIAGKPVQVRE